MNRFRLKILITLLALVSQALAENLLLETLQSINTRMGKAQAQMFLRTERGFAEASRIFGEVNAELVDLEKRVQLEPDSPQRGQVLQLLNRTRMNCVTGIGNVHTFQKRYVKALDVLQEFQKEQSLDDPFVAATLHKDVAANLVALNRLGEARKEYEGALAAYGKLGSQYSFFDFATRVSYINCLKELGETEAASRQFRTIYLYALSLEEEEAQQRALAQVFMTRSHFRQDMGEAQGASEDFEALLRLPVTQADLSQRFSVLVAAATLSLTTGELEKRRDYMKQAEQAFEEAKAQGLTFSPVTRSLFYFSRATDKIAAGQSAAALRDLDLVDQLFVEGGGRGLSPAFTSRLSIYERQGRLAEHLPEIEKYLASNPANTLENLELRLYHGGALAQDNQVEKAVREIEFVLARTRESRAQKLEVESLASLARVYASVQKIKPAKRLFEEAISLSRRLGRKSSELSLSAELLELEASDPDGYLKDPSQLRDRLRELTSSTRRGARFLDLTNLLVSRFGKARRSGNLSEAEEYLDVMEDLESSPLVDAFLGFGRAALKRERGLLTSQDLDTVSELVDRRKETLLGRQMLKELIQCRKALGQDYTDELVRFRNWAVSSASLEDRIDDLVFLSDVEPSRGLTHLGKAETLLRAFWEKHSGSGFSRGLRSTSNRVYERLIRRHLAADQKMQAFEAAERGRGQSLKELFRGSESTIFSSANPAQRARLDRLYARREDLNHSLQSASAARLYRELQEVDEEIESLLEQVAGRRSAGLSGGHQLEKLRAALGPEQVLLRYYCGPKASYLFVVTNEGLQSVKELPDSKELFAKVEGFRQAIRSDSPNFGVLGQELSRVLFPDLEVTLSKYPDRILVPDGPLFLMPFAAIPQGGVTQSIKDSRLSLLPSGEMLPNLKPSSAVAGKALVFANPQFGAPQEATNLALTRAARGFRLSQLPGAEAEAFSLRELARGQFRVDVLTGTKASKNRLFSLNQSGNLGKYKILHFATHGILNQSHPEMSGIVLSLRDGEGRPQNGYLRLLDLYRLDLNAELVVLSACSSGLGEIRTGEGLLGLHQGFLLAGGQRVLSTLWDVDDKATARLMESFYRHLFAGIEPKQALSWAQREMAGSEKWSAPKYWAGFQLVSR